MSYSRFLSIFCFVFRHCLPSGMRFMVHRVDFYQIPKALDPRTIIILEQVNYLYFELLAEYALTRFNDKTTTSKISVKVLSSFFHTHVSYPSKS